MRLKVHSIENRGKLEKETLWLDVLEPIGNLSYTLVAITSLADRQHISTEIQRTFWFPSVSVEAGDWIALCSGAGAAKTRENDRETTTHLFYWNLKTAIWTSSNLCAVVFDLESWHTHRF